MITKKDFEIYEKVKQNIESRCNEIFHLLKGITVGWNEYYESCSVDSELDFRVGGNYRGEYDYETYQRPLDYLFMTDEEITNAEEELEKKKLAIEKERKEKEEKEELQRDFQLYNQLKEKLGLWQN